MYNLHKTIYKDIKKFKGVMIDLAKICRGEETAAVLAGWNMSEGGGGLIDLS